MRKKQQPRHRHTGFLGRWRGNFLTGLVVIAPLYLTIYIVWGMIRFIDGKIVPLVPGLYNPETYIGIDVPGFGLIVFVLVTAIVGAMTKGLFGRQIVHFGERMVDRMPIVRSIYNALKQILETVLSQSSTSFQHVVTLEYPRKGTWGVGFLATTETGEISATPGRQGNGLGFCSDYTQPDFGLSDLCSGRGDHHPRHDPRRRCQADHFRRTDRAAKPDRPARR